MKVAYDGSGLTPPLTGVGNYIDQLLTHLLCVDQQNEYRLLSHRSAYVRRWANGNARAAGAHFPNRLLWMQCVLPFVLHRLRLDVVHFTNAVAPLACGDNLVLTIHDLSLLLFPSLYRPREHIVQRPFIRPSARRARAIITVSAHSKCEIVRALDVAPQHVHVIHEAAAPIFHEPISQMECAQRLAAYGWDPTARNLLYVGRIEPRKNVERLVSAVKRLHQRNQRAHLWVVGHAGWHSTPAVQRVRELGLEPFAHLTGYVPVADLRAFYHACDLFVFPSLYEGFGLPLVEAMACGTPMLLSDTPTLREIGADAADYFDPTNAERIADALCRALADEALRADLRVRARARATQFSWERAARETLEVYRIVAGCE